ncbi:MAG TPA: alpha/beta hydrolase domain-containing protein [Vicinamibacterales bacterium]
MLTILTIGLLFSASSTASAAQSPFTDTTETAVPGGVQLKGKVAVEVDGQPASKRFVLRVPAKWNGSLVIGAHGGSGGDAIDRAGRVYATSETALDDVIGSYAFEHGFAYASVDRDGIGNSRAGYGVTTRFATLARAEVTRLGKSTPLRIYIVGLSAGGGITRMIVESMPTPFDGAVIIAGAGADLVTRLDRQTRMAALWPLIDPRAHSGISDNDSKVLSYAEALGTPVAARRLWPYTGAGAVAAAARPAGNADNSTARPSIPTIEVVGTWDDLVIREVRAYRDRVEPKDRHRLYQVEGVWHMSGDDDGVQGFQFAAESRMKLGKDVADAMGESPSYIPTVREAFDHLVRWVEKGTAPPASQMVKAGGRLR